MLVSQVTPPKGRLYGLRPARLLPGSCHSAQFLLETRMSNIKGETNDSTAGSINELIGAIGKKWHASHTGTLSSARVGHGDTVNPEESFNSVTMWMNSRL